MVGQQSDHRQAIALLAEDVSRAVAADKGYDSSRFAKIIAQREAVVVILFRANANEARCIDV